MGLPVFRSDLTAVRAKRVVEVRKELSAAVKAASNIIPFPTRETTDLGRALVYKNSKSAFGILAHIHPFYDGQPHPSSLDGLDILIRRLRLGRIRSVERLGAEACEGTATVFGGPVSSREARFIFGKGDHSPLVGVALPFSFRYWDRMAEAVASRTEPWEVIVGGVPAPAVRECLIVTVLPVGDADRIVSIAGLHGAGTRAIDLVLRDRQLLERVERETRNLPGWQFFCEVIASDNETPTELGETLLREINGDFDSSGYSRRARLFFAGEGRALDDEQGGPHNELGTTFSPTTITPNRSAALRRSGEGARTAAPYEEQQSMHDPEWARQRDLLLKKTFRDHFRDLDEHIRKHGRELTPEEEEELLRPLGYSTT